MQVSRRQFLKCFSASSAAVISAPVATLGNLSSKAAATTIAKASSAYLRLNTIEHAVVSTYAILDAAGSIRMRQGLIDGAGNTAYILAANTNYMLSEASTPEAREVLLRLLRPRDAGGVIGETGSLFIKLQHQRAAHGLNDDIDDFCASYMAKLNRAIDRIGENRRLSRLVSPGGPADEPLTQRVAGWCDKIFSGELEQLSSDPLFNALSTLHRMEISREHAFTPNKQRQILEDLKNEGFPNPEETIYGQDYSKRLRACELVAGAIEHELVTSQTFHHPPYLITATQNLLAELKGHGVFAWEDFYRSALKRYVSATKRDNAEFLSLSLRADG